MPHVPILNASFEVSPTEAATMWSEAVPMWTERPLGESYPSPERVRKTPDNKWVVRRRMQTETEQVQTAAEFADTATQEFLRLQEFGINVISRAFTPSAGGNSVFTISPFVDGIVQCKPEVYKATMLSRLRAYFAQSIGSMTLTDIRRPDQYSHLTNQPRTDVPFLHDVDPYMAVNEAV